MRKGFLLFAAAFLMGSIAGVAACLWGLTRGGHSARAEPTRLETVLARKLRSSLISTRLGNSVNPVVLTSEVMTRSRAHFADHCALCHGNDGKGQTAMGRNLYPRAPDMTLPSTQSLKDGE